MKKIISLVLLLLSPAILALTAEQIAQKVDSRDTGDSSISTLAMILIDKHNNRRVRNMKNFSKEFGKDSKTVIFFLTPADVKNTAFLTFDYDDENKDDDQWLYLPALKKSKRIASSDKSASFMGSDFSYSDMTKRNIANYDYKIVKESQVKGAKVWIIETLPKTQKIIDETGYTKSYMFVRQDNFVVIRALHFLVNKNKKYLDVKKLQQIDGIWVATEIEMKTKKAKQTLHKTILKINNIKFNRALKDSFFSLRTIEKGL